jgi:hypothetical protein
MPQMIGALCHSLSLFVSIVSSTTSVGRFRVFARIRVRLEIQVHLDKLVWEGTSKWEKTGDLKLATGPYRRPEWTSPYDCTSWRFFVHRMGCFFHPAPDPLLTNIVLQSTFGLFFLSRNKTFLFPG